MVLAVFDSLDPPDIMIDEPTSSGTFTFEWSPEPDCSTMDASCGTVNQLRLDASAGGELLTLDPSHRYGVLSEPPNLSYGLWVGDSWISECDGQPTRALRYALVALP